jgi:hypothetical protein
MSLVSDCAASLSAFFGDLAHGIHRPGPHPGELVEALKRFFGSHSIRLETSSKCQLKCPACPTARGLNRESIVGWDNLSFESFERFITANPRVRHVELSNWGEIFLNPDLKRIVSYA